MTFANYRVEREAFRSLFLDDCKKRILLFTGKSGIGKSALLQTCRGDHSTSRASIGFELRNTKLDIEEILSRSSLSIGSERLPKFSQCMSVQTEKKQHISLSNVSQKGQSNSIAVTLNSPLQTELALRQSSLTYAWFDDIKNLDFPYVMVFDNFESATSEVSEWLTGTFLPRTVYCNNLRVVIAGQTVPEPGIEDWSEYHALHELYGVKDARDWMPVVTALGKVIPSSHPIEWMAGTCNALKGRPAEIMAVIEALPNAEDLPQGRKI